MKIVNFLLSSTNCSKIISTGSCWEYNDCNIIGECSEEIITDPKNHFLFTKVKFIKKFHRLLIKKMFYLIG